MKLIVFSVLVLLALCGAGLELLCGRRPVLLAAPA